MEPWNFNVCVAFVVNHLHDESFPDEIFENLASADCGSAPFIIRQLLKQSERDFRILRGFLGN